MSIAFGALSLALGACRSAPAPGSSKAPSPLAAFERGEPATPAGETTEPSDTSERASVPADVARARGDAVGGTSEQRGGEPSATIDGDVIAPNAGFGLDAPRARSSASGASVEFEAENGDDADHAGDHADNSTAAVPPDDPPPTTPSELREPSARLPAPSPLSSAVLLLSAWNLPEDWLRLDHQAFEEALDRWFPAERSPALSAASLQALGQALDRDDEGAVRAAVVLARSRDPEARETLLVHLERRLERGPERGGNAADVVAAAAFDPSVVPTPPERPRPPGERTREPGFRLEALASGSRPHPDLEVRVECARSALALGRDGVIPFLLRVLREGTTAASPAPDWKRGGETAWSQSRAAGALSRRAGVPAAYAPEGSIAEREAEAARLEQRLPTPRKPKR